MLGVALLMMMLPPKSELTEHPQLTSDRHNQSTRTLSNDCGRTLATHIASRLESLASVIDDVHCHLWYGVVHIAMST